MLGKLYFFDVSYSTMDPSELVRKWNMAKWGWI